MITKMHNIENILRKSNISHRAFCEAVGLHTTTWQRWRNGICAPNLRNWEKVEEFVESLNGEKQK